MFWWYFDRGVGVFVIVFWCWCSGVLVFGCSDVLLRGGGVLVVVF